MRIVHEAEDAIFMVDDEKNVFSFTWKGTVTEETAKRILGIAAKAAATMDSAHWIIDRTEQEGYTTEARVWIKTKFLESLGKELINKTEKIAAVKSNFTISEISSGVIMDTIMEINPDITYQKFESPLAAKNWIIKDKKKASTSQRFKKLFGK